MADDNYAYIYKVSFFESRRHSISWSDMYFADAKDTHFALQNNPGRPKKVFYIRISKDTLEYTGAVFNSNVRCVKEERELMGKEDKKEEPNEKLKTPCNCVTKGGAKNCYKELNCKACGVCLMWKGYEEGTEYCGYC